MSFTPVSSTSAICETESTKPPILLVDDEADILFSLTALLRRDFEVFTAETGAEALRILSEREIHVLMTDQRMPEMTGAELTKEVYERYPDTTRILFTGYADIKSVIEAINTGGLYRYITKPWDPDELVELLHEAAHAYQTRAEEKSLVEEAKRLAAEGREVVDKLINESDKHLGSGAVESFALAVERVEQKLSEKSASLSSKAKA